jgi:UDPglucose 6-dehydrogenase
MVIGSVSVIGLGKLGAVFAAVAADSGYEVVGVDVSERNTTLLNEGRAPVEETGLQEMIGRCRERLRATTDVAAAVLATDSTFVVVPTPSGADGLFQLDQVMAACGSIGRALREKDGYHLVVICSTVVPGSTEASIVPALEALSGKRCGQDFGVCYNPEFIALGSVIRDMLHPDMLLIGECDSRAGDILEGFYRRVCRNNPPVRRMNFVNAEITKISVNTFVTTKISYANMLAELCERMPGADVEVVTGALGSDTRIGGKYLKGALGYGGPCFPRDNQAFAALARACGVRATLAEATDEVNRRQAQRLAEMVRRLLPEGGTVSILGLSYKPDTNVAEESQGVALAMDLAAAGIRVVVYDPAAMENARLALKDAVEFAGSFEECVGSADVLVLATPWREFAELAPAHFAGRDRRPAIVDCWRLWKERNLEDVADYVMIGAGAAATPRRQPQFVSVS